MPRPSLLPMRHVGIVAGVVLAVLTAGAVYYGIRMGGSPQRQEQAREQLQLAQALATRGEPAKALAVLDQMQQTRLPLGEEGAWLRVDATRRFGNVPEAARLAEAFLKDFPASTRRADVESILLASHVETAGVGDAAVRGKVEAFLQANPGHAGAVPLEASIGRQEVAAGNVPAATERFNRLWASAPDAPETRALGEAISQANLASLSGGSFVGGYTTYKIKRGDAIFDVARAHGVTPEIVLRANGIENPRSLRIGQELRIPNAKWSLHCDVGANAMKLLHDGQLFRLYTVRTGREPGATPKGEYKLLNKKKNPTWRPGNGHIYQPGDPNNELGTRWMAFEGDILGIHGTIREDTIGSYASNGCIGMRRADVEELFDLVTTNTALTIVGEQDPTRHKILPAPDVPPPQQVAMR